MAGLKRRFAVEPCLQAVRSRSCLSRVAMRTLHLTCGAAPDAPKNPARLDLLENLEELERELGDGGLDTLVAMSGLRRDIKTHVWANLLKELNQGVTGVEAQQLRLSPALSVRLVYSLGRHGALPRAVAGCCQHRKYRLTAHLFHQQVVFGCCKRDIEHCGLGDTIWSPARR